MPIVIDYENEIITITSPTTEVDGQTLHDQVQDEAASPEGSLHPYISQSDPNADTEILYPDGKIEDPGNPGVFSQIILRLNARWQIQFWGGSGYTRIFGAKFVGGLGGQVMKATGTAGDITVLESPVDGVTVATESGDLTTIQTIVEDNKKLLRADELEDRAGGKVTRYEEDTANVIIEKDITEHPDGSIEIRKS